MQSQQNCWLDQDLGLSVCMSALGESHKLCVLGLAAFKRSELNQTSKVLRFEEHNSCFKSVFEVAKYSSLNYQSVHQPLTSLLQLTPYQPSTLKCSGSSFSTNPGSSLSPCPCLFCCLFLGIPPAFDIVFFTFFQEPHLFPQLHCNLCGLTTRSISSPFISLFFLSSTSLFLVVCWKFF